MPSAVAGFLIPAARRLQGWDSYERPVAADLKTSAQALARGADAHGSGGRGLSIREITCIFAQNQQSCLLYRNNVDDATPYKSIIVTPAYWRSAESRFETVAAGQINPLTDSSATAADSRAAVEAAARTLARPGLGEFVRLEEAHL